MADKKISALTAATTPLAGTEVLPIVQGGSTVKVAVSNLTDGREVSLAGANSTENLRVSAGKGLAWSGNSGVYISPEDNAQGARIAAGGSFLLSVGGGNTVLTFDATTKNGTFSLGNLVVGTAGKGIDFSANANAPGMTSEVLTWYEQGTWTPVLSDGTNNASFGTNSGWYTRVGNLVTVGFSAYNLDVSGLSSTATPLRITGLPFTSGSKGAFNAAALPLNLSGENLFLVINSASTSIFINRATGTVDATPLTRAGAGTPNNMSVYGQIAYNV